MRRGSCEPLKTVTIERHGSRPLWAVAVRQANGGRRPSVGGTNDRHVRRQRRPTTQFCLADNSFELHVATAPVTDVLAPQGCEATHLAGMAGKGPARGPIRPQWNQFSRHNEAFMDVNVGRYRIGKQNPRFPIFPRNPMGV